MSPRGVYKRTAEHIQQNIKNLKGGLKGKQMKESTKIKLSKVNKGRKMTPEQIEKIRKGRTGLKHSKETKKKMANSIHRHHTYLKENSDDVIKMPTKIHQKLHLRAYHFIYYKYGKKGIDEYLKWFNEKYGGLNDA